MDMHGSLKGDPYWNAKSMRKTGCCLLSTGVFMFTVPIQTPTTKQKDEQVVPDEGHCYGILQHFTIQG
jgi:hypothetical protein